MSITETQIAMVKSYLNPKVVDVNKVITYLKTHDVVDSEIFISSNGLRKRDGLSVTIYRPRSFITGKKAFCPVSIETFLRRLPIYYCDPSREYSYEVEQWISNMLSSKEFDGYAETDASEQIYGQLEYLYNRNNLSPRDLLDYINSQLCGRVSSYNYLYDYYETFMMVKNYIELHYAEGISIVLPRSFLKSYNLYRQTVNQEPLIVGGFDTQEWGRLWYRDGKRIIFPGWYPVDENEHPLMEWIGIKVENGEKVEYRRSYEEEALVVTLTPFSTVHILKPAFSEQKEWECIYVGPQHMIFDHNALKQKRVESGMTQKELSDAIGASVRTYQKWENGDTNPDAQAIIRIMNWLEISDVQELTKRD